MEVEREDPAKTTETDSQVDQELTPAVHEHVVSETASENGNAPRVNEILSLMTFCPALMTSKETFLMKFMSLTFLMRMIMSFNYSIILDKTETSLALK